MYATNKWYIITIIMQVTLHSAAQDASHVPIQISAYTV